MGDTQLRPPLLIKLPEVPTLIVEGSFQLIGELVHYLTKKLPVLEDKFKFMIIVGQIHSDFWSIVKTIAMDIWVIAIHVWVIAIKQQPHVSSKQKVAKGEAGNFHVLRVMVTCVPRVALEKRKTTERERERERQCTKYLLPQKT